MVPVKRKDLFKLLGLNDPLDIVDPTEVKLFPQSFINFLRQSATDRGALRCISSPIWRKIYVCPTVIQSVDPPSQLASVSGGWFSHRSSIAPINPTLNIVHQIHKYTKIQKNTQKYKYILNIKYINTKS